MGVGTETQNTTSSAHSEASETTSGAIRPVPSRMSMSYYYGSSLMQRERPLREYWNVLVRFRVLIGLIALVGMVLGHYYASKAPIVYGSTALINIGSYVPPLEGPTAEFLRSETSGPEYIDSILPLIKGYTLADSVLQAYPAILDYLRTGRVAEAGALARSLVTPAKNQAAALTISELDSYLSHISFSRIDSTPLIKISSTGPSAALSSFIANAHADELIAMLRSQRTIAANVNVDFMKNRLIEAQKKALDAETHLIDFAQKHELVVGEDGIIVDRNAEKYVGLVQNLSDASLNRAQAEGEVREMRKRNRIDGGSLSEQSLPLYQRLLEMRNEQSLLERQNRNHVLLPSLRRSIRNISDMISANQQQQLRSAEVRRRAATERQQLLQSELNELKKSDRTSSEVRLKFSVLEQDNNAAKELVSQVQKRLDDAAINAESDQRTIRMMDPAVAPSSPLPQRKAFSPLTGILFGAMFGIVIALVLDAQNTTIRSMSDLREAIELPVLGSIPIFRQASAKKSLGARLGALSETMIPHIPEALLPKNFSAQSYSHAMDQLLSGQIEIFDVDERKPTVSDDVIIVSAPQARASEAFRNIRTTLKFASKDGPPKTVLVTSGQKGDGKTTVAANLAAALANTGARTVIVDADLRMPRMHQFYPVEANAPGLVDYLGSDWKDFSHCLSETGVKNLCFISAGSFTSNPAEILGSKRMQDLIAKLAESFEHVIVDTPPIGEIADALLLTGCADGVLLVVRSGETSTQVAEAAYGKLKQVSAHVLGTTLNGVRLNDEVRYGYT